ncbi:MAG: transporter [Bacteroidota bacterium]|nr:transporter [Bacteroidota bacterium]
MTEEEFVILEELYFVIKFTDLQLKSNLAPDNLIVILKQMIQKGWVNYFTEVEGVQNPELKSMEKELKNCYFLATKKGLFAHNSN